MTKVMLLGQPPNIPKDHLPEENQPNDETFDTADTRVYGPGAVQATHGQVGAGSTRAAAGFSSFSHTCFQQNKNVFWLPGNL